MGITDTQKMISAMHLASLALGKDATLRQLTGFLRIAQAGKAGIDATTLERKMDISQASTSRVLKLLGPELGLIELFLDQADGRRRLARLSAKGEKLFAKIAEA